jgi:hypothetical protein
MNHFALRHASSFVARSILVIVIAHLIVGVCVHAYWSATSNEQVLRGYFDYEGIVVFLLFGVLQAYFAIRVFGNFSSHQPLGLAWQYIMLASVCNFIGIVFKHLLAANTAINPAMYTAFGASNQTRQLFGNIGTVLGGPIQMILLGTGLYMAIRAYRQFGMLTRLKALDVVLIGASLLYAIIVIGGVVVAVRSHPDAVTIERGLTWPGDYLISLLLLEAVFLRRAASEMGWGYVSKIWGALVTGIFLTSFCSLMNWLTAYGVFTWTQTAFVWYLWYPASAAFALAPVYQWEAMRTARMRLAKPVDELGLPAI